MKDDAEKLPTILMVDVDEAARSRNAAYLRAWGFDVIETENAVQCLSIIAARPEVSVLFTRVALEGLNGFELALEVRRERPGIEIVLATNDVMAAHKIRHLCDQHLWTK